MMTEQLTSQTVALMNQIAESADPADFDTSMRVVQQATRLLEAVTVRRTEVHHVHLQEPEGPAVSPA